MRQKQRENNEDDNNYNDKSTSKIREKNETIDCEKKQQKKRCIQKLQVLPLGSHIHTEAPTHINFKHKYHLY